MRGRPARHVSAGTLIVWLIVAAAPAALPHALPFDPACSEDAWGARSAAADDGRAADASDDHCVICHLQRAAREALAEPARAVPPQWLDSEWVAPAGRALAVRQAERTPARAPPAFL
jgi:hypothetical protein